MIKKEIGFILLIAGIAIMKNIDAFFNFQKVFQNNDETKQILFFLGFSMLNLLFFGGLGACIMKLIQKRNKGEN